MKSRFPLFPVIRESFINALMQKFQQYELIVTDCVHGKIMAVITNTPCIVLDWAISHKLSGYEDLLCDSVAFPKEIRQIPDAIPGALNEPNGRNGFQKFFCEFAEYSPSSSSSSLQSMIEFL